MYVDGRGVVLVRSAAGGGGGGLVARAVGDEGVGAIVSDGEPARVAYCGVVGGLVPRVIGLAECLREWIDHRRVVLQRRSTYRLGQIERRLEILGGLLIVYLDLDEVIRIIREEDEPKPALMKRFELTEIQANAILDTTCAPCASSRRWS